MVQSITASLAHKAGIRINTVCAWGTSKYAFDGSGEIKRHDKNGSICTFTNGKIYNADLSASYNITSRYFIKEIQKTISAKKWLDKVAKVPSHLRWDPTLTCENQRFSSSSCYASLSKRSTCTLDTLIKLNKVLQNPSDLAVPV